MGNPPLTYNVIQDYGRITLQDAQNKAQTYVGQQVQNAQDSYMLHLFIIESLTDTFKSQVLLYEADYTITPQGRQQPMKDGPTLLKTYLQAPNTEFKRYLKMRKAEYWDEHQDYTVEQLMLLAENKKNLKQSGEWGKLTEEEAEIVALNAKLDILKYESPKKQDNKMKQDDKKSPTPADKKKDEAKDKTKRMKTKTKSKEMNSGQETLLLVSPSSKQNHKRMGTMGPPQIRRMQQ